MDYHLIVIDKILYFYIKYIDIETLGLIPLLISFESGKTLLNQ